QGQNGEALSLYQTAYQLDTDFADARRYYAGALVTGGQEQQARALLAPIMTSAQIDQFVQHVRSGGSPVSQ
ncbi:MAG TPA: tetratricopeptide repeat protein, partial [Candidatus Paceibacterota bacterium]|nr:tetratricopeptide repeat protein [Candidatus Paceibacterota bacterium]